MAVSLPQFIEFMQGWHASAPVAARSKLPVSSWSQIYRMCEADGDGLYLDPDRLTGDLLDGDAALHASVAVPLSQAVAAVFPSVQAGDLALAEAGAQETGQPIGTVENPAGRIGAPAPASLPVNPQPQVPVPATVPQPTAASQPTVPAPVAAQPTVPAPAAVAQAPAAGHPVSSASSAPMTQSAAGAPVASPLSVPAPPAQAPVPGVPQPPTSGQTWVFPAYDYTRENLDRGDEGGDAVEVSVEVMENGSLRYRWPDAGEGEVYRVVVSDEEQVYDPAEGVELTATEELSCTDATEHPYALHFVSVWGYARIPGTQELGQCRRVASVVHVHPLAGWKVEFDQGSWGVIGRWEQVSAPPGISCTVVTAKLPVGESPHKYLHGSIWRSHTIANTGAGFQDREVVGGRKHHYVAVLEAEIDGSVYTSSLQHMAVLVPQRVEKVTDLEVEQVDNLGQATTTLSLNLTWSENKGSQVAIYLSPTPPNPAAVDRGKIPTAQLESAGLKESCKITIPAGIEPIAGQEDRQRRSLVAVPWPDDVAWDSIYVTAVVLSGQEATLAEPVRAKRVAPPTQVAVSRHAASHDLITFAWPGEAAQVQLYKDEQCQALAGAVTQERYRKDGGLIVPGGALDSSGGMAYLTAVQHLAGQEKVSRPAGFQVPPMWVYRYDIHWPGMLKLRSHTASLEIAPIFPVLRPEDAFSFCLVRNPDHLPLGAWDGEIVPLMNQEPSKDIQPEVYPVLQMPPMTTPVSLWFDSSQCNGYYVRLVLQLPTAAAVQGQSIPVMEHYALLDPQVATLDRRGEGKGWFK